MRARRRAGGAGTGGAAALLAFGAAFARAVGTAAVVGAVTLAHSWSRCDVSEGCCLVRVLGA